MIINKIDSKIDSLNNYFRKLRQLFFSSFIVLLSKMNITPNGICFLKVVLGVVYVIILKYNLIWALGVLILAFITDVFDGPLARYTKTDSDRGKFIDVLTDHLLYTLFLFGLILHGFVNPILFSYTIVIIPILYLMIIINKNETIKTDWIINPSARVSYYKLVVWGSSIVYLFSYISSFHFNKIIFSVNVLITIHFLYHFINFLRKPVVKNKK